MKAAGNRGHPSIRDGHWGFCLNCWAFRKPSFLRSFTCERDPCCSTCIAVLFTVCVHVCVYMALHSPAGSFRGQTKISWEQSNSRIWSILQTHTHTHTHTHTQSQAFYEQTLTHSHTFSLLDADWLIALRCSIRGGDTRSHLGFCFWTYRCHVDRTHM